MLSSLQTQIIILSISGGLYALKTEALEITQSFNIFFNDVAYSKITIVCPH